MGSMNGGVRQLICWCWEPRRLGRLLYRSFGLERELLPYDRKLWSANITAASGSRRVYFLANLAPAIASHLGREAGKEDAYKKGSGEGVGEHFRLLLLFKKTSDQNPSEKTRSPESPSLSLSVCVNQYLFLALWIIWFRILTWIIGLWSADPQNPPLF